MANIAKNVVSFDRGAELAARRIADAYAPEYQTLVDAWDRWQQATRVIPGVPALFAHNLAYTWPDWERTTETTGGPRLAVIGVTGLLRAESPEAVDALGKLADLGMRRLFDTSKRDRLLASVAEATTGYTVTRGPGVKGQFDTTTATFTRPPEDPYDLVYDDVVEHGVTDAADELAEICDGALLSVLWATKLVLSAPPSPPGTPESA